MPPHKSTVVGRQEYELVDKFANIKSLNPSCYQKINDNLFSSVVKGINLAEYCTVLKTFCHERHNQKTCGCQSLINAGQMILDNGIVPLAKTFKTVCPGVTYHVGNAKQRLLQLLIIAMHIHDELYLMEKIEGLDYSHLTTFLSSKLSQSHKKQGISKDQLEKLFLVTQNERERACLRVACYKMSGFTQTKMRKVFGFERMNECISEIEEIHHAVAELVDIQKQAILDCYDCGQLSEESEDSDESSNGEASDGVQDTDASESSLQPSLIPDDLHLLNVLHMRNYNWFEFIERMEQQFESNWDDLPFLESFFLNLPMLVNMQLSWLYSHTELFMLPCSIQAQNVKQ